MIDKTLLDDLKKDIRLEKVIINEERFFKITNVDQMRPFFMSIVSAANHWLFVSSNGGITAGRQNAELALFPYYTDDKITEEAEFTGSKTIFQVVKDGELKIWEPFSIRQEGVYKVKRNLYKNRYGNKILFEAINYDLELIFRYQWNTSDIYGFVKKSELLNTSDKSVAINVIDGIQNIMPWGVESDLQKASSNLVDAYKRSELEEKTGLGIYALSAIIVDKATPSEALKANTVWSLGMENPTYLLSSQQLKNFRKKEKIVQETEVKAEKGAYFIQAKVHLAPKDRKEWMFIAEVNQDQPDVIALLDKIQQDSGLFEKINQDIQLGTQQLIALNAASDGLQFSSDALKDTRHFSNTLFNIMRGGIFDDNYHIDKEDVKKYMAKANREVAISYNQEIEKLPQKATIFQLRELAIKHQNKDFQRLCFEYMPLKFSRRHGDPSRPWNKFSINTRNEDGSKKLDYEGNWRDIFQNWEALVFSYPAFIESMVYKFLNTSTFDGYNPYRITKDGFDWEVIEPDNPWSYIGYWGDHQIIYLLKLLAFFENYQPNRIANLLDKDIFVYVNIPYQIRAYEDIIKNPKDTIVFDVALDDQIRKKRTSFGADGALLQHNKGETIHVNFIEKILATTLAKIANFIPEAGIWMNTQRPEWNDANNALVGNGVSMVTLCYLRRFLGFFQDVFRKTTLKKVVISEELAIHFKEMNHVLHSYQDILSGRFTDCQRKKVLDGLGKSASRYRNKIYQTGFSGNKTQIALKEIVDFVAISLQYMAHTIKINKRTDNLYHAYNLMTVDKEDRITISYLDEMLEGQVAVLSTQSLKGKEVLTLLEAMKTSRLFRSDQYSYLLYPFKELKGFLQRNIIPKHLVQESKILDRLIRSHQTSIVKGDVHGDYHFNGNFKNAEDLTKRLEQLDTPISSQDKEEILQIFEQVFNHKAFTGRSGTFYGYEGLGSIYWHMVSKLKLAVQECCLQSIEEKEAVSNKLITHYYEVDKGIGVHKPPILYGAFPTDPYSHTPAGRGAQQPGMTGQVKEDILSRFGELGVFISKGKIHFAPSLLRKQEFTQKPKTITYLSVVGEKQQLELPKNSIAFTYCQVLIRYQVSDHEKITIQTTEGKHHTIAGLQLDEKTSYNIFHRTHEIQQLHVYINEKCLR